METLVKQVRQFIEQEIELYGDDYIVTREIVHKSLIHSASEQSDPVVCDGNNKAELIVVLNITRPADAEPYTFWANDQGELLTKILASVGFDREQVFLCLLANIIKNKFADTDADLLFKKIQSLNPAFILCFGQVAGQLFSKSPDEVSILRGKEYSYHSATVLVTHHPEQLIKNSRLKRETWDDMKRLQRLYNDRQQ